jgi:hypothetical protein
MMGSIFSDEFLAESKKLYDCLVDEGATNDEIADQLLALYLRSRGRLH